MMFLMIGFGVTGQDWVRYFLTHSPDVRLAVFINEDVPIDAPKNILYFRRIEEMESYWGQIETVGISPGIPPNHCVVQEAKKYHKTLLTDLDWFVRFMRRSDQYVIGVTGTNGKSTVVCMIQHLLNEAGISNAISGNFQRSITYDFSKQTKVYVLELSSFQLYWSSDLSVDTAVLTNLADDHLNWHGSQAGYHAAKFKLFLSAKRIVCLDDQWGIFERCIPEKSLKANMDFYSKEGCLWRNNRVVLQWDSTSIYRACDQQNACLALEAVSEFTLEDAVVQRALCTYKPLEFRAIYLGKKNGIHVINDSKSTNLHSLFACLEHLKRSAVVLIVGGDSKGQDLSLLSELSHYRVRVVVCFGKDACAFKKKMVSENIPVECVEDLSSAFKTAVSCAEKEDYVVFSPACSSLDMFQNYVERGKLFDDFFHQWLPVN